VKSGRIPVWLVTGFLGSGKTTLLTRWLRDPVLAGAALVVNEIGEVGFDDRQLAGAVDSAALIGNTCICCTGLPGLEQVLTDLWWDRLQRRRPRFDAVVIESTGLADPRPVQALLAPGQALGERYRLAAVITTVSARAGAALIDTQAEAKAQIAAADVVVITKLDLAEPGRLADHIQRLNPNAAITRSSNASTTWPEIAALSMHARPAAAGPPQASPGHDPKHTHHAGSRFVEIPAPVSAAALHEVVRGMHQHQVLRIKGVVRLQDGSLQAVQWAPGDTALTLRPFAGDAPQLGLTCITATAPSAP
jgi:G3E family GTPase